MRSSQLSGTEFNTSKLFNWLVTLALITVCGWAGLVISAEEQASAPCEPKVVAGSLDLTCLQEQTVFLKGEWVFSWQPLTTQDAKGVGEAPEFAQVPGRWRSMPFVNGRSPAYGQARYSIQLNFDQPILKDLALSPGLAVNHQKILLRYPDGTEQTLYDNLMEDGRTIVPSGIVMLPAIPSGTQLVLIINNDLHFSGAVIEEPQIGELKALLSDKVTSGAIVSLLFGGYVFFGLYNLILAFGYRRDKIFFVLALICFICAFRMLGTETLITAFLDEVALPVIWYLSWGTLYLLGAAWAMYIYYRFPLKSIHAISRLVVGVSFTGLALVLLTGPHLFVMFGLGYRLFVFACLALGLPAFIYGYSRRKLENGSVNGYDNVTVSTVVLVSIGAMVDIVLHSFYTPFVIDLSMFAFFLLIAGQSFIVARQYTRVLENEKALIEELKVVNQGLEKQVLERTGELQEANEKLEEIVRTDQLTGLPNRNAFEETLLREMDRFDRTGLPLSLFILDADHFKAINDKYGHDIGDIVLKHLGEIILQEARVIDMPSRIGGEEFAIILTQTDLEGARLLAERIRQEVEKAIIYSAGEEIRFTISGGIAAYKKDVKSQELFRNADQALYTAKETGRNKIVISSDLPEGESSQL